MPALAGERHTVVTRLDTRWQLGAKRRVIHVGVQIGQDRALRLDLSDPFQRLVEMEMARVRRSPQRVDDPDLQAYECSNTLRWKAFNVSGVGDIAKAEPERGDVAVILQNGQEFNGAALPLYRDRLAGLQAL